MFNNKGGISFYIHFSGNNFSFLLYKKEFMKEISCS